MSNRAVWTAPAPEFRHPLHSMYSGQPRLPPEPKGLPSLAPNGAVRSSPVSLPGAAPAPPPAAPAVAAPAPAAEAKQDPPASESPKEAAPPPAEEPVAADESADTAEVADGKKKGKKGGTKGADAKAGE